MPFEVSWYKERRVLYERLYGELTLNDVFDATQSQRQFAADGIPLVHTIADVREVVRFPTNISLINNNIGHDPKLFGWNVVVGTNPMIRFIVKVLAQLDSGQYYPVATIEDAVAFLIEQDSTLADMNSHSKKSN
jgi:hypothetical protein